MCALKTFLQAKQKARDDHKYARALEKAKEMGSRTASSTITQTFCPIPVRLLEYSKDQKTFWIFHIWPSFGQARL